MGVSDVSDVGKVFEEERVNDFTKKTYKACMKWRPGKKFQEQEPETGKESEILQRLLKEMGKSLNYRNYKEPVAEPFLVCDFKEGEHGYRIESVTVVTTGSTDPVVELKYHVDFKTFAVTKLHLKPKKAPVDLNDELMDAAESWIAFKPRQVMNEMVGEALTWSLENHCETEVEWEIEEVASP